MLVRRVWPSRPTFDSSFSDFDQIRREMLRLLDTASGDTEADGGAGVFPPLNISQDDNSFYIRAEVPGVKKEDMDVRIENGVLTLRGERKQDTDVQEGNAHRMERIHGAFTRSFGLPTTVEATKIAATYKDGVLEVTIPKAETARHKMVEITAA